MRRNTVAYETYPVGYTNSFTLLDCRAGSLAPRALGAISDPALQVQSTL